MTQEKYAYELKIQKFWEDNNVYGKVKEKNKSGDNYNFVEGPPYPTGEAHLGHMRNWAIKDATLRLKRFQGYNVYARDGYDAHGLPVENKTQKKLNLKTVDEIRSFGVDNFINECRKYAYGIINDMKDLRARYALWMDRDPYLTFHPEYISMAWRVFKKADEKGLLYKDYKTVAWCPHDETTLSDYEIKDTYTNLVDPSIYVKFPIKKELTTTGYDEYFVIWTTTPWTLQSNMAIAMHPQFNYAKVLVELDGKEEVLVIAESLVESVIEKFAKHNDIKLVKVLEVKPGAEFEGTKYDHIYLDETPSQREFLKEDHKHMHSIVMADFVTLGEGEDIFEKLEKRGYKHSNKEESDDEGKKQTTKPKSEGTGLVHIAPGHGFDDYEVGRKYNIPIFCPVDRAGKFNEGKYEGMYFKDVDPVAIDYLKKKGYLLLAEKKEHRYPCCWRCKTPIVYRAADQWWLKRSEYAQNIIDSNSNVHWFPPSARESFNNLMAGAGDWAISRQRFWGIPLPIFEDEDGNYRVFESKEELESEIGHPLEDLHLDNMKDLIIKNHDNGNVMRHVGFTADVWFDSGCASFASHYGEGLDFDQIIEKYYPMNWITEGEDQIRGWFSSLFNVGQIVTGKAPYNRVLFQGFVMDKFGQKMSKSLGNGISGNEALELFGADKTRYYLLTKNYPYSKLNFDLDEFAIVDGFFNTLDNAFKFANNYLEEHELRHPTLNTSNLDVEDLWILYRLNKTIDTFVKEAENFKFNFAFREVEDFIVRDFSKTYLKLVKDRTEERDENLLVVLNEVLKKSLIMLSNAIPFKAEELYQQIKFESKKESIYLENMPDVNQMLIKEVEKQEIHENFEIAQDIVAAVLSAREKAKIGVRWPLSEVNIVSSQPLESKMKVFEKMLKELTNVHKFKYDLDDVEVNYIVKPNFATLKEDFDNVSDAIKAINMSKFYISNDLKNGKSGGTYEGVELDFEKHIIKEIELKEEYVSSDFKGGFVILHTHQDEILLETGFLRELVRRVQSQRKDIGLNKKDEISLSFAGSDEYFTELVSNWEGFIMRKVGAKDILQNKLENEQIYEIKDKILHVSISK